MQLKVSLKFIVFSLIALFPLSACESSTTSSSDQALETSQQETQSAVDGNRMSANAQQQPEIPLQTIKLYPIDEGLRDRSFAEFRNKLLKAARGHDAAFILSILDRKIINGSDSKGGVKEFKDQWNLDQPESRLWETLTTLLSMGGSFRANEGNREFCAPYVTSEWPSIVSQLPKGADPLDYQVIIEKDVGIDSAPNTTSQVVASLSYDVVNIQTGQIQGSTWLKIRTLDGKEGYVADKYFRGATDYQACFKRIGEKWLMTELAARE